MVVNASEVARFDTSGKLGIGANSIDSDALLHLKSTQPNIRFEDTDDSKSWRLEAGSVFKLQNVTTGSEVFRVDQSGNLGIGQVPGVRLHVEGATNSNVMVVNNIGTAPNYIFDVRDDGVSKLRVDPSGNLLVGKTALDNTTAGTRINSDGSASFVKNGNLLYLSGTMYLT